jgi:hypothetical protein
MTISQLIRNNSFFRDKLDQVDKTINSNDFDAEFKNIKDYLNNVVKPVVDKLVSGAVGGVAGNENAFLRNVGDGTTSWDLIGDSAIDNYTLALSKLVKSNAGSVICSDGVGAITASSPTDADQVLISRLNNTAYWKKLTSINIANSSLTGDIIGELGVENFLHGLFINNVLDDSIDTMHIANNNITNSKLIDATIDSTKLGIFNSLPLQREQIQIRHLADASIQPTKVKDDTMYFGDSMFNTAMPILSRHISVDSITPQHLYFNNTTIDYAVWAGAKYYDGMTDDPNQLHNQNQYNTPAPQTITQAQNLGYIINGNGKILWQNGAKLGRQHIAKKQLSFLHFNDEVRAALTKLGVTKNT